MKFLCPAELPQLRISGVLHKKFFEAEAEKPLINGHFCCIVPAPKEKLA